MAISAISLLGIPHVFSQTPDFQPINGFSSGPVGPESGVILSSDGLLYGTTAEGGCENQGTIYRMNPNGSVFETLVHFTGNGTANKGSAPVASLVEWTDTGMNRYFYGTTRGGGTFGLGTVFRVTPTGMLETLVHFTGVAGDNIGATPEGALILGSDGFFYGTTAEGGAQNQGTIFRLTPGGVLTTLFEFDQNGIAANGIHPRSALIETTTSGVFFGTTSGGGNNGDGTVFQITDQKVITTLLHFSAYDIDRPGAFPVAPLIRGSDGNYYGTTKFGGRYDDTYKDQGTVFKMTPAGEHTVLAGFIWPIPNEHRGCWPAGAVIEGNDGFLYGTTYRGGNFDRGVVYRVGKSGGMTTIVDFDLDLAPKGAGAAGSLIQIASNEFIGTTSAGGTGIKGTVFRLSNIEAYSADLTTLAELTGRGPANENGPEAALGGLAVGMDGYLYGTTSKGGLYNKGTVFRATKEGVITVLVEFTGNAAENKGAEPANTLVQGVDGNFYGCTGRGGTDGLGTLYRMTPAGDLTTLVEFTGTGGANPGSYPEAGLLDGGDGYFYGSTSYGGMNDSGTIFRLSSAGIHEVLISFTGTEPGAIGSHPSGTLCLASDGNLYGTTENGGQYSNGTAFRISPAGVLTTIYEFNLFTSYPQGLIKGSDGLLYGVCRGDGFPLPFGGVTYFNYGNVFRLTTEGEFATLYSFYGDESYNSTGRYPEAALFEGNDGFLYGTTSQGGGKGNGTLFRCATYSGFLETLFEFTGCEGSYPGSRPGTGQLILDSEGYLYGITSYGGVMSDGKPAGLGQLYRLSNWEYVAPPEVLIPRISVTGPRNFGTQLVRRGTSRKTFTIQSTGTATLSGLAVKITGKNRKDFTATFPETSSLAPNSSTTFRVTFRPRAKGVRKATLKVGSNAANANRYQIAIKGRGK